MHTTSYLIAHDFSPQTHERRSLTLHLQRGSHATMKTQDFWMVMHTQQESEAQHLYTNLKSPTQKPREIVSNRWRVLHMRDTKD